MLRNYKTVVSIKKIVNAGLIYAKVRKCVLWERYKQLIEINLVKAIAFIKTVDKIYQLSDLVLLCYSNTIQFTHTQIEAIRAGMQPGLTMVRMFLRILFSYLFNSDFRYIQWHTSNAPFCSLAEVISINSLKIRKINIQRFNIHPHKVVRQHISLHPVFQWLKVFCSNWVCFCSDWRVFK